MSDDLWAGASADHEGLAREAALARAEADFEGVFPFLAAARSEAEFGHRLAIASDRLEAIASAHGLPASELATLAGRRWELLREALQEGQDPLDEVVRACGEGHGSGPEKPDEHSTSADYSHSYSEIPCGASGGPDPQVIAPRPPRAGPVAEPTAMRKQADMMTPGYQPPPAPMPQSSTANLPAGLQQEGQDASAPAPAVQATASMDPVRRKVLVVTAAVRESNPYLPPAECERVARLVVGRYLRQADLASQVMDDDPGGGDSGPGSAQGGHSGMSGPEEYLVGRGLIKAAPELLAAL